MTEKQKPVIWAIFGHYFPNYSGAAIQGRRSLTRLASNGYKIIVLASGIAMAYPLRGKKFQQDGMEIVYLRTIPLRDWMVFKNVPGLRKIFFNINALFTALSWHILTAIKILQDGKFDQIVQFFSFSEFSYIGVWAARLRGLRPFIRLTMLGSDDPFTQIKKGNSLQKALIRGIYNKIEKVITLSSALSDSCLQAGISANKIIKIPNGVDTNVFCPLSEENRLATRIALNLNIKSHLIIFVGAANSRKGIDILIEAFIKIASSFEHLELLIIGPSDFRDLTRFDPERQLFVNGLKSRLTMTGFNLRVHWIGEVDNVHQYLQASNIFCLPTRKEGLPNAIIEAMSIGLPIVTSRLDGITTDLISSDTEGILIDGYDMQDYADAIIKLVQNPGLAMEMGIAARARAVGHFNVEVTVSLYEQLYSGIQ